MGKRNAHSRPRLACCWQRRSLHVPCPTEPGGQQDLLGSLSSELPAACMRWAQVLLQWRLTFSRPSICAAHTWDGAPLNATGQANSSGALRIRPQRALCFEGRSLALFASRRARCEYELGETRPALSAVSSVEAEDGASYTQGADRTQVVCRCIPLHRIRCRLEHENVGTLFSFTV